MSDDELAREVRRLVGRISHWTPPRWAASSASGAGTRADAVHALVQHLADLAADAEGQPHRPVPRLPHDTAIPDQLKVVATDLIAAGAHPDVLTAATAQVTDTNRTL